MMRVAFALLLFIGAARAGELDDLRLNQIQVVGTHNSYHIAPSAAVLGALDSLRPRMGESLDYTHRPLTEQFGELGIRQIELDVFADPEGGRYADPAALRALHPALPAVDDYGGAMREAGMKVMHVQDVDQATTVPTFVGALRRVRDWLRANPAEGPILILVEMKDGRPMPLMTEPLPFDAEQMKAVDAEIFSVFDPEELITPDDVRGEAATLREAVLASGWPTVGEARGKVLLKIDNRGQSLEYAELSLNLAGRAMFPDVPANHPAAAMFNKNDPLKQGNEIRDLVRQGFLVRTRADSGTHEARSGDTAKRDAALASGAQFISTDYPEPDERFTDYRVRLPGGAAMRSNPVTAEP